MREHAQHKAASASRIGPLFPIARAKTRKAVILERTKGEFHDPIVSSVEARVEIERAVGQNRIFDFARNILS